MPIALNSKNAYLLAIFPDIFKSNEPIAHVMDDTNKGTIKLFSILFGANEGENTNEKQVFFKNCLLCLSPVQNYC